MTTSMHTICTANHPGSFTATVNLDGGLLRVAGRKVEIARAAYRAPYELYRVVQRGKSAGLAMFERYLTAEETTQIERILGGSNDSEHLIRYSLGCFCEAL